MDIRSILKVGEAEAYDRLVNDEARKEFLKEVFKARFEAFVWLLGYRDTGKFHVEQMAKIW
jgi:hypothetical protein